MLEIVKGLALIIPSGGIGGLAAWWLIDAIGLDGTLGAIVTTIVGMVLAVAAFAALTASLRALGLLR